MTRADRFPPTKLVAAQVPWIFTVCPPGLEGFPRLAYSWSSEALVCLALSAHLWMVWGWLRGLHKWHQITTVYTAAMSQCEGCEHTRAYSAMLHHKPPQIHRLQPMKMLTLNVFAFSKYCIQHLKSLNPAVSRPWAMPLRQRKRPKNLGSMTPRIELLRSMYTYKVLAKSVFDGLPISSLVMLIYQPDAQWCWEVDWYNILQITINLPYIFVISDIITYVHEMDQSIMTRPDWFSQDQFYWRR